MKKIFVLMAAASLYVLTGSGCTKDKGCQEKTIASEDGIMTAYATANGITAIKHSSGIYYEIITPGNAAIKPTIASTIKATYTGKLLDGSVFDSRTTNFPLANVIAGWQIGIPLIGEGGRIKLIIPSSLAYGCAGRSPIEPYSVLYFEVELVDVL